MTKFEMFQIADMMYKEYHNPFTLKSEWSNELIFWDQVRRDMIKILTDEIMALYDKYKIEDKIVKEGI